MTTVGYGDVAPKTVKYCFLQKKKKKESEMMFSQNEKEMTYKVLYSSDTEFKFSY